jgi:two-component system phosphate regulon sensor histidine kinase PhoR
VKPGARGRLLLLALALLLLAGAVGSILQMEWTAGSLTQVEALWLGASLSLLAAAWLANAWTRPLREVASVAEALARGLSRRAPVLAEDEHGQLAEALNHLARRLETAREELHGLRERFDGVLGGMREGVVALSTDGRVALCNPSAERMLGVPGALLGQRLLSLVREPALHELLTTRLGTVGPMPREIELAMEGGRILAVRAEPLHRADLGTLLVLRDLTPIRRLETVRRDFVANASHELRTPLATIQAAAEALRHGALEEPAAAAEFVEVIHRHAERMGRILSDLLDLSRLEAGAWLARTGAVPVAERLQHNAALIEPAVKARRQTLTVRVVLSNLLDNASKYTPMGGSLQLTAVREGHRVIVRVADDGPGIPQHHRERVFERFYRVDPGRSRQLGGTGLGLSIVRHLVEAMGGHVTVEANAPQGAVFVVELLAWEPVVDPRAIVSGAGGDGSCAMPGNGQAP